MPRRTAGRLKAPSAEAGNRNGAAGHRRKFLVAVGASAGGLDALGKLLKSMPRNFAAPIVAVLHLDPQHRSQMAPLLQRHTDLQVKEAEHGETLRAGTVYLARPNRHLEVRGGRIQLARSARIHFSRPSVDLLFSSAAKTYGDRVVAIVLSGTGSDGTVGVSEVKGAGGLVLAQDLNDAEFPGMPESATKTGCVDVVAPVAAMPALLRRAVGAPALPVTARLWNSLFELLREEFGTDFGKYRPSTIKRRLQRRILATGQRDLKSYIALVRRDRRELQQLHEAFLIKVSAFMRDPREWARLNVSVVRALARRRSDLPDIRVWSAACATGEEAYSLAILFLEALGPEGARRLKVFATDIDEAALSTARAGVYTAAQAAGLPRRLRERYFSAEGDGWRAKKSLRNVIVFGRHDLLNDPHLASIDLIACRNVLIYFTPDDARSVLSRFVHALRPGGFLFLGRSEGVRAAPRGFERIAPASPILRRTLAPPTAPGVAPRRTSPAPAGRGLYARQVAKESVEDRVVQGLLLGAANVILFAIDGDRRITFWNRAAEVAFGLRAAAVVGQSIEQSLGAPFWGRLLPAVHEVRSQNRTARLPRLVFQPSRHGPRYLDVECIPFPGDAQPAGSLLFVAIDATEQHSADARQRELLEEVRRAASDTTSANQGLQAANEELETLNEELQSTSEEQQTLNEELESRNEELQTVNEELQSMNEELNTLNEEVGARIAEAERLSAYLRTVLESAPRAVIGCDERHKITFWSPAATKTFHLSEAQALGKNLLAIAPAFDVPAVRALIKGRPGRDPIWIEVGHRSRRVEVRATIIRDAGGRRHGYVLRVQPPPASDAASVAPKGTKGKMSKRA